MTDLTVTTEAAETARTQLHGVADSIWLDLRSVNPDSGSPAVRAATEQWLAWIAMTSGAFSARATSSGDSAATAAGVLTDADRSVGQQYASTVAV